MVCTLDAVASLPHQMRELIFTQVLVRACIRRPGTPRSHWRCEEWTGTTRVGHCHPSTRATNRMTTMDYPRHIHNPVYSLENFGASTYPFTLNEHESQCCQCTALPILYCEDLRDTLFYPETI